MDENTPIIVGGGQCVERESSSTSPSDLAAKASTRAIEASGGTGVIQAIDTIVMMRLFSDSAPNWENKMGRSNNPPQSVAKRIGANPSHRVYSEIGGNEPQTLLMEYFAELQEGTRECVLLCGAEAIRNQRVAESSGVELNWNEEFDEEMEDRGPGAWVVSQQEVANNLFTTPSYYTIMEDVRRQRLGFGWEDYAARECEMLSAFSRIAAENPYAQFPFAMTVEEIASAEPMTHLYTKRMVAQDKVNQGAAILLTTVGKAKELGIPESNWVYMHGAAKGLDHEMTVRPDPSFSAMGHDVVQRAFDMAELNIRDISLIEIYSCYPVAVTAIAEELGLATDGSDVLSLTGGLPYFGGPGSNYATHGLAEMWSQLRKDPTSYGFLHGNGGILSKHGSGIFSCEPSIIDWSTADTIISTDSVPAMEAILNPDHGTIKSYVIDYAGGEPTQAVVLGETDDDRRFVAHTRAEDQDVIKTMAADDTAGRRINVTKGEGNEFALNFSFAD